MSIRPRSLVHIAEIGILQFFMGTIIAMVVYPGGTLHSIEPDNYSFLNNFFSDLGRTHDFEGNVNPSRWIFTAAVIFVGGSMMAFFYAVPTIFEHDKRFKSLKYLVIFFGVIAGMCYIGVAFTPYDKFFTGHEISVKTGFTSFFIVSIIMTWMIYKSTYYPNIYGHIFIVFDVILLYYILLMFFGPDARASIRGLHIQVISQKLVIYSQIICMFIQMAGARKVLNKIQ